MKRLGRYFSIAAVISLASASAAGAAPARPAAACDAQPATGEFAPAAPGTLTYPHFCDIPAKPTDVEAAPATKARVVRTRQAGAWLVGQSAPSTFGLTGTENFNADAVRLAKPPPPMTGPGDADTATFAAKAKAKATPPHKPH